MGDQPPPPPGAGEGLCQGVTPHGLPLRGGGGALLIAPGGAPSRRRPRRGTGLTLPALLLLPGCLASPSGGAPTPATAPDPGGFAFAVVGDTPYSVEAERVFPELAREISEAEVAFVVHVGDLKGSEAPCTDSLLASRVAELDRFGHPLVFVPGDNDWTDCHREPPGAHRPLERLALLRRLAYPVPGRSRGRPAMRVRSQVASPAGAFPEHQRWTHGGVVFVTLHAVGSRNGLVGFPGRGAEDDAEVEGRIAASVDWLREAFAQARASEAPAVVVALQANPWVPDPLEGRTGFEELLETLAEESAAFRRPVLLVHGDSHTLRMDRPFWAEEAPDLPNLVRLETYGDPDVGWVEVTVDPRRRGIFGFTPHPVLLGGGEG